MLDFDLASIYEVETKALNQAVKRNYRRFEGEEFMFQLTSEEWKNFTNSCLQTSQNNNNSDSFSDNYDLRSQIVTSRFSDKWGGIRRSPYAFTEIGVASSMLSALPWQSYRQSPLRRNLVAPSASFSLKTRMKINSLDFSRFLTGRKSLRYSKN